MTFVAVPPPDEAGRHLATAIQLLAPGTISASFEENLPGKSREYAVRVERAAVSVLDMP